MASPAPDPSASPQHSERRWNLLSALTVAIVSGLVVGVISFVSSYRVASQQIESQARQAQEDFLRGQRQEVYADFLAAALSAKEQADIIADKVNNRLITEEDRVSALMEKMNVVTVLNQEIQLIGEEATRASAEQLTEYLQGYASRYAVGSWCRRAPHDLVVTWWCDADWVYSGLDVPDIFTDGLRDEREHFIELAAEEIQGDSN